MENFVPLSVEEQQHIAANMAAFHAMCLSRDDTPTIKELEQPPTMCTYFQQRFRYWQHLCRNAFTLS